MDIVEYIKQQIDENKTELDLDDFRESDIFEKMKDTDILYRVKFSFCVHVGLQDVLLEYAESDYPWSLIQNYALIWPIYENLSVKSFNEEKLIDLTSHDLYSRLLHNMVFENNLYLDHFINHYRHIDDPESSVLWDFLEEIFERENISIPSLKCYLRLVEIKPLVINQIEHDRHQDTSLHDHDSFNIESKTIYYNGVVRRTFPDEDISNIDVMKNIIRINDSSGEYDDHSTITKALIIIFPALTLSEQTYFITHICQISSIRRILKSMNTEVYCEEFIDSIFDNYPVGEWFDDPNNVIFDLNPYFCHKLLLSSPHLKDKIMSRLLTNQYMVLKVFPDINSYDINNVIQRTIDGIQSR